FRLGNLKTAGSYTLTATAGAYSGTSSSITVTAANAAYFRVATPATAVTGSSIPTTVTALDPYGNIAAGYTGHVHFTSSDPKAAMPVDPTLASSAVIFTLTLYTSGNHTTTATDIGSTIPIIVGNSSHITTRG